MANNELRNAVYAILTVTAVAAVAARIANAEFVFEPSLYRVESGTPATILRRDWPPAPPLPMPTFSSNDRSRWCTVRALVDHGTWVIGHRDVYTDPKTDRGIVFEEGWKAVDKVLRPDTQDYYSSKPPLLTVFAAGEYWLLKHSLGWTITRDTNKVVKTILFTFNALPLLLYLTMLRRLLERFGTTDWGRLFVFAAACFGTFLTTFAVTLNNHTPAAVVALAAVYPFLTAETDGRRFLGFIPLVGLPSVAWLLVSAACAGLAACLELPALAFTVALAFFVLLRSPLFGCALFVPVAALVICSEVVINRAATGEWSPTYAKFGGPWYEYPGSHWLKPNPGDVKHGIDWARMHESHAAYVFHCLIGHHGLFSLTPIWLFAFWGMIRETATGFRGRAASREWAFLFPLTLSVSVLVIGFYLVRTNNYGGWTSGLRWLFWFTPLWLLTMLPVTDRLAEMKWGRRVAYLALAVSVFSASFPTGNPWRHPWLYRLLETQGWIAY